MQSFLPDAGEREGKGRKGGKGHKTEKKNGEKAGRNRTADMIESWNWSCNLAFRNTNQFKDRSKNSTVFFFMLLINAVTLNILVPI